MRRGDVHPGQLAPPTGEGLGLAPPTGEGLGRTVVSGASRSPSRGCAVVPGVESAARRTDQTIPRWLLGSGTSQSSRLLMRPSIPSLTGFQPAPKPTIQDNGIARQALLCPTRADVVTAQISSMSPACLSSTRVMR
jgi:hypothetical protein